MVIPRARPSGSGVPQPAISAASSSARSVRGLSASRSRRRSTGSRPAAIASSSIADSRANSVCELPTDRHTIVGTPDSKLVDSSLKFSNVYGGSAAPVVVKKSTPPVNMTSRTNGRFVDVGSATICWWYAVR